MLDPILIFAVICIGITGLIILWRYPFVGMLLLYMGAFIDTRNIGWFKIVEKLILFTSFGFGLLQSIQRKYKYEINIKYLSLFAFFLALAYSSAILNNVSMDYFIAYAYGEGKVFIALFIFLLYPLAIRETKWCFIFLMLPVIIQIAFLLKQAIASGFAPPIGGYADYYRGTFAEKSNFLLAIAGLAMLPIALNWFTAQWPKKKIIGILLITYLTSLPIITESKTILVLEVALIIVFYSIRDKWQGKRKLKTTKLFEMKNFRVWLGFLLIIVISAYLLLPGKINELINIAQSYGNLEKTNVKAYKLIWDMNTANINKFFLGQGPGQTMSSVGVRSNYFMWSYYDFKALSMPSLSIAGSGTSSLGAVWGDLGTIGLIYCSYCLYLLLSIIKRAEKLISDNFSNIVVGTAQFLFLLLIGWGIINVSFENWLILVPFGVCLSFLAGQLNCSIETKRTCLVGFQGF